MRKKGHYHEQENDIGSKQNIPITLKSNTRGRNTSYYNQNNDESLNSPIRGLKLSRQSLNDSNPEKVDSSDTNRSLQQSDQNIRLKENMTQGNGKDQWPHWSESSEIPTRKQGSDMSKIELGQQKVIHLPVLKNHHDQDLYEDHDAINETASQNEQPDKLPNSKSYSPAYKSNQVQKVATTSPEAKLFVSDTSSNLRFSPRHRYRPNKPDVRHAQSISEPLMSPRFQKCLGQSHSRFKPKILSPLYPRKAYHHNQLPLMVQSQTLPKSNNIPYRTALIKQQLKLTFANNLDKILFMYHGGSARVLSNNKLKIKNDSDVKIQLKIMSTNPSHYDVRPYSAVILSPSQILNVLIQMKLHSHDINRLTMKHDLSRYKNDKFKICYCCADYWSEVWYESGSKVLPVLIEETEQEKIRSKGLIENKTNEELKMIAGQKAILTYKTMIEQIKKKVNIIDFQIRDVHKNKLYTKYFTKSLFWLTAITGLTIGYWLG